MEFWKQETVNGNRCFALGDLKGAKVHYEAACGRANRILYGWFDTADMVAALVVSYQNLAEMFFVQNRNTEALLQYHELHNVLVTYRNHCLKKQDALRFVDSAFLRMKTELLYILKLKNIDTDYANSLVEVMSSKSVFPKTTLYSVQEVQCKIAIDRRITHVSE